MAVVSQEKEQLMAQRLLVSWAAAMRDRRLLLRLNVIGLGRQD